MSRRLGLKGLIAKGLLKPNDSCTKDFALRDPLEIVINKKNI